MIEKDHLITKREIVDKRKREIVEERSILCVSIIVLSLMSNLLFAGNIIAYMIQVLSLS